MMKQHENDQLASDEKARLDRLDSDLRGEADNFLRKSGLGRIITNAGFAPVGSYVMRTMVWRDLDFERMVDPPNWVDHWILGQALAETGWAWRLSCVDAYRDQNSPGDLGHYWGIRASDPDGGPVWKLDLWTARPCEFAPALQKRAAWEALMTDEARLSILAIKEVASSRPEYRKTLLSVHIYEAVLEKHISTIEAFWDWWYDTYSSR